MRKRMLWLAALIVAGLAIWVGLDWLSRTPASRDSEVVNVKVQLEGAHDHANLVRNPDGTHSYVITLVNGQTETLSPEQFASRIFQQHDSRSLLAVLFNISSPYGAIWVGVGLLGQVLFTGRMLVQWLISEKQRRSVVPAAFWWLSVAGALMLLTYFLWRKDLVGVIGQGAGLAIYVRNLHLIAKAKRQAVIDPELVANE